MEEIKEVTETPAMLEFRLKDIAQQYHNMLTCIHDLKESERDQILTWKAQTEDQLTNLQDAEVAIHP